MRLAAEAPLLVLRLCGAFLLAWLVIALVVVPGLPSAPPCVELEGTEEPTEGKPAKCAEPTAVCRGGRRARPSSGGPASPGATAPHRSPLPGERISPGAQRAPRASTSLPLLT